MEERSGEGGLWASDGCLLLATLLVSGVCLVAAERVPVGNGFGWDGVLYGAWARDFPGEVFEKRVNTYYIQRVLPSAVVHYSLRALGLPRTDKAILTSFAILGLLLTLVVAVAWCGVVRHLRIGPWGKWLGWIALVVNYVCLKYAYYLPASTDMAAYALGCLLLWAYLARSTAGMAAVALAGAFTWPMMLPVATVLLLLPRENVDRASRPVAPVVRWGLPGLLAVAIGVGIALVVRHPPTVATVFLQPEDATPLAATLPLAIGVVVIYLFAASVQLLDASSLYRFGEVARIGWWIRATAVAAGVVAIKVVQGLLARDEPFQDTVIFLRQTAYTSVQLPCVFLASQLAFYGLGFLLIVLNWAPACREAQRAGRGACLCFLLALLLSINCQSRFYLILFPLVLAFAVKGADGQVWTPGRLVLYALAALLLSKVWLRINTGPFCGRLHEFPDQGLFLSHGPWISPTMVVVQGGVFIALLAAFAFERARAARMEDTRTPRATAQDSVVPANTALQ